MIIRPRAPWPARSWHFRRLSLAALSILAFATVSAAALAGADDRMNGTSARAATPGAGAELEAVLRTVPNREHGKALFRTCSVCHGAHDASLPIGWVPEIAGQYPRVIAKQLVDYRHGARWDLRMEIIAGRHVLPSDQDIADVAAYVAGLNPTHLSPAGHGEDLGGGKAIYRAACADCHGRVAEGSNARFVPRLAGQQYDYLLRQLHDAVDGRRPNLGSVHVKALENLDARELEALADYLSRLEPSGTVPAAGQRGQAYRLGAPRVAIQ